MPEKSQFIVISSGAGGPGKTWLTGGLGACLADRGQRCLLVDGSWGFSGLAEQLVMTALTQKAIALRAATAEAAMEKAGLTGADIDWIVPHQANIRILEATAKKLADLSNYQSYTCLAKGGRKMSLDVERTEGKLKWSWKPDTVPFTPQLQARLIKQGRIKPREGLFQLHDDKGKPILVHRGSVCWK